MLTQAKFLRELQVPGIAASAMSAIKFLFLLTLKSMHFNLMFSCLVFMGKKQQESKT